MNARFLFKFQCFLALLIGCVASESYGAQYGTYKINYRTFGFNVPIRPGETIGAIKQKLSNIYGISAADIAFTAPDQYNRELPDNYVISEEDLIAGGEVFRAYDRAKYTPVIPKFSPWAYRIRFMNRFFTIDIFPGETIGNLKERLAIISGIPADEMQIIKRDREFGIDSHIISKADLKDIEQLEINRRPSAIEIAKAESEIQIAQLESQIKAIKSVLETSMKRTLEKIQSTPEKDEETAKKEAYDLHKKDMDDASKIIREKRQQITNLRQRISEEEKKIQAQLQELKKKREEAEASAEQIRKATKLAKTDQQLETLIKGIEKKEKLIETLKQQEAALKTGKVPTAAPAPVAYIAPSAQLFIKDPRVRKSSTIDIHLGDTVLTVKRKIEKELGIPIAEQQLLLGGHQLEDYQIFSESMLKQSLNIGFQRNRPRRTRTQAVIQEDLDATIKTIDQLRKEIEAQRGIIDQAEAQTKKLNQAETNAYIAAKDLMPANQDRLIEAQERKAKLEQELREYKGEQEQVIKTGKAPMGTPATPTVASVPAPTTSSVAKAMEDRPVKEKQKRTRAVIQEELAQTIKTIDTLQNEIETQRGILSKSRAATKELTSDEMNAYQQAQKNIIRLPIQLIDEQEKKALLEQELREYVGE